MGRLVSACAGWNPNGTLDFRFNDPSYHIYDYIAGSSGVHALLPDNYASANGVRIIAGGNLYQTGTGLAYTHSGLVRLSADGSVDPTFDIGSGAHDRGSPSLEEVDSLAMQADGKILAGGMFTAFGTSIQKYLARINPNGSSDLSFSPSITGSGQAVDISSIVAQPDGKIVIGGTFLKVDGFVNTNLARINAAGGYDASWDDGIAATNGCYSPVTSLLLRPDGRILVASQIAYYAFSDPSAERQLPSMTSAEASPRRRSTAASSDNMDKPNSLPRPPRSSPAIPSRSMSSGSVEIPGP